MLPGSQPRDDDARAFLNELPHEERGPASDKAVPKRDALRAEEEGDPDPVKEEAQGNARGVLIAAEDDNVRGVCGELTNHSWVEAGGHHPSMGEVHSPVPERADTRRRRNVPPPIPFGRRHEPRFEPD